MNKFVLITGATSGLSVERSDHVGRWPRLRPPSHRPSIPPTRPSVGPTRTRLRLDRRHRRSEVGELRGAGTPVPPTDDSVLIAAPEPTLSLTASTALGDFPG